MNHLTFEQSEEASLQCDYAIDAAGTKENPINWGDAAGFYLSGYNTACDEAEKQIQETTELANRSYQEGLMDGRLPIPGLEKEIAELKQQVNSLANSVDRLAEENQRLRMPLFKAKLENPPQIQPGIPPKLDSAPGAFQNVRYGPQSEINDWPPTMDQALRSENNPSQVESDWHTKHLTAHIDFDERLRKLEASAIMDGDAVIMNQFGKTLKHLIHKIK